MVKTAAEKMREYRKRLKDDPEKYHEYLTKAKERKLHNYKPVCQLTRKEKEKRREKTRSYVKRHRDKKKIQEEENRQRDVTPVTTETSGYETNSNENLGPLVVNLPFPNRKNGPRRRVSRALSKKHREFKDLKLKYGDLQKKYKRHMRSLQRYKKKAKATKKLPENVSAGCSSKPDSEESNIENMMDKEILVPNTPKSKTKQILAEAGLNKAQSAKIRKHLLLSNVLQAQAEKSRRGMKRTYLGALRGLVGGKILTKYSLGRMVNKSTGLGRNRINKTISTSAWANKIRRRREIEICRDRVLEFFMRDDNSRCNPGKQDKLKVNGETRQTRTLTDYLKNLYLKFRGEHPNVKLSLASFCRIRPANIRLTRFISRNSCLCTKHQNFALCNQALRKLGLNIPLNSEKFIENESNLEKIKAETPQEITFGQWKRVSVDDKGKKKMVMRIIPCTMDKNDFIKFMEEQIKEFKQHVYRVRHQYEEPVKIKQHLPKNEIIVQMDFAENYSCKGVDDIQSAWWNQTSVTLHPVVLYYKDDKEELKHESIVIVSDEMGHNSSVVVTFLDAIVPKIKKRVPNVHKVHYYTDSPTSQYRNKIIFHAVANHQEIYECGATWNYFEAGHGKGPCDGLGGTVKRMADEAVRSGKATIQDAEDFFKWTQSENCSMKTVHFMFVQSSVCQQKSAALSMHEIKPVKGTMKLHAVVGKGNNTISTSNVSCYCEECISDQECKSNQWAQVTLEVKDKSSDVTGETVPNEESPSTSEDTSVLETIDVSVGSFVAAKYEGKIYIGKILEYDEEDLEFEITFMQNVRQLLQWPQTEDKLWLERDDIVCNVNEPMPTGKSKRMFKLMESDLNKIESKGCSIKK